MQSDYKALSETEWCAAHATIAAWKNDPAADYTCPKCEAPNVSITDNSVRPYAEWFIFSCASCGLEVAVHLPQAPTPGGSV